MIDAFYSDPHFGHRKVIDFCDRPFTDLDHMHEAFILRYNQVVKPFHTVCWAGDTFFSNLESAREILSRMNGRKLLVRGNHDGSNTRCAKLFDFVTDRLHLRIAGRHCVVSHYPYAGTEHHGMVDDRFQDLRVPRVKGQALIHGHSHSKVRRHQTQIHVGVDAWDYRPVTMAQVEKEVGKI